ncbi:hypothetical protein [Prosthecobacter sp.]
MHVWVRNCVFAWGLNANGELGDTTTDNRSVSVFTHLSLTAPP